jgi:hypothetical protein
MMWGGRFSAAFCIIATSLAAALSSSGTHAASFCDNTGQALLTACPAGYTPSPYVGPTSGGGSNADVVGDAAEYDIMGATVSRSGSSIKVEINTNFNPTTNSANAASQAIAGFNAVGTGALFLGLTGVDHSAGISASDFKFVIPIGLNPSSNAPFATSGTTGIYAIAGGTVQQSWWPSSPDLVNFTQKDTTFSGNTLGDFRTGQAVGYYPTAGEIPVGTASWSYSPNPVGPNTDAWTLTFIFSSNDPLFNSGDFSVADMITCANDILMINDVNIGPPSVPLPGAFFLMGTVFFGAGGIAKWRKSRAAAAA